MASAIDPDKCWASLKAAEEIAERGTNLLKEISALLTRKDVLSPAWLEERRIIRDKIEAHLRAPRMRKT